MKKLSLISLALASLLACGTVAAQPGPRPDPEARLEKMTVLLDLDAAQQAKVRAMFERQHAQRQERRESRDADREARRIEHQQRREAFLRELSTVLTPSQMQKFEVLTAERRGKGPGRRGPGGRGSDNG